MSAKSKTFMFVVPQDQYNESDYSSVFKWGVVKPEISDEGFKHYQCLGVMDNMFRESAIKEKLPKAQVVEAKSLKNALDYVLKDDTTEDVPIMFGNVPIQYKNKIEGKSFNPNAALSAACRKRTYQEAIDTFSKMCPWEYVKNKKAINAHLSSLYTPPLVIQHPVYFSGPPITFQGRQMSVLLVGPSGIGKTQYALSQFNCPLVVTCKQDFNRYSIKNDGILIDDMPWSSHAPETLIRLLNAEIPQTIDIKYGSTTLPTGIRKIFTLNCESQFWPHTLFIDGVTTFDESSVKPGMVEIYKAIRSRIKIITCHTSLFNTFGGTVLELKLHHNNNITLDASSDNADEIKQLLYDNTIRSILNK